MPLKLPDLHILRTVDTAYREEFERHLLRQNAVKARLMAWVGVAFTVALFTADYMRWQEGLLPGNRLYVGLFLTHAVLALMIIPAVLLTVHRGRHDLERLRLLTALALFIAGASMLPMAIFSLIDRGTITMFGILMLIYNLVFTLSHRVRLAVNLAAIVPLVATVLVVHGGHPLPVFIEIAEAFGLLLPAVIFATVQYNLQVSEFERGRQLEAEKNRSEALLLNILPAPIAEELKAKGWVEPRFYPEVSILFIDFVGFSRICRGLSPRQLIEDLSYCFRTFDEIVGRHGLERIKTIGDAYMCMGGVTGAAGTDHAARTVAAALEMQRFLTDWAAERRAAGLPVFEARIGIHTGPVVGGVAGAAKFAFDIWGDAVNVAARIESAGEANRVNISGDTRAQLGNTFRCTFRGNLPVKNIGEQAMFFVDG